MKYRILDLANWIPPVELYEKYGELFEFVRVPETREALLENIGSFDGYISSLKIRLDEEVLNKATNLKAVFTPSTGLQCNPDHLHIKAASQRIFGERYYKVFATRQNLPDEDITL